MEGTLSSSGIFETSLRQVRFTDLQRARENFARIGATVPAPVAGALPPLLVESPDPDSALNLFERLTESGGEELFRLLRQQPFLIHYATAVFGY